MACAERGCVFPARDGQRCAHHERQFLERGLAARYLMPHVKLNDENVVVADRREIIKPVGESRVAMVSPVEIKTEAGLPRMDKARAWDPVIAKLRKLGNGQTLILPVPEGYTQRRYQDNLRSMLTTSPLMRATRWGVRRVQVPDAEDYSVYGDRVMVIRIEDYEDQPVVTRRKTETMSVTHELSESIITEMGNPPASIAPPLDENYLVSCSEEKILIDKTIQLYQSEPTEDLMFELHSLLSNLANSVSAHRQASALTIDIFNEPSDSVKRHVYENMRNLFLENIKMQLKLASLGVV